MSLHATSSTQPPQTPTRALLTRLRRRSSLLNTPASSSHPSADDDEEQDLKEIEDQIERLILERQEKEAEVNRLRAQLNSSNRMDRRATAGDQSGLTWEAAKKLEGEFEAQEMILKGLQRDNESKTIEVEQLRRQMRTISEFMTRQYGDEWEEVVCKMTNTNNGNNTGLDLPDLEENPLKSDDRRSRPTPSSSPLKKLAFQQSSASNILPDTTSILEEDDQSSFMSAKAGKDEAEDSFEAYILERKPAKQQDDDSKEKKEILDQIEKTKMLLQGFARRNAKRHEELLEMKENADQEMIKGREFLTLQQQQIEHLDSR
ncbi:unnamed protein product [Sympodiomycopsis kandeliae]